MQFQLSLKEIFLNKLFQINLLGIGNSRLIYLLIDIYIVPSIKIHHQIHNNQND